MWVVGISVVSMMGCHSGRVNIPGWAYYDHRPCTVYAGPSSISQDHLKSILDTINYEIGANSPDGEYLRKYLSTNEIQSIVSQIAEARSKPFVYDGLNTIETSNSKSYIVGLLYKIDFISIEYDNDRVTVSFIVYNELEVDVLHIILEDGDDQNHYVISGLYHMAIPESELEDGPDASNQPSVSW